MSACAVCNAPPPLTLTRNGLRCSKCLLGELETLKAIVHDLAKADPSGIVDYEGNWSEVTPGEGAIEGCRFCGERQYGPVEDWKHADGCLWRRAVESHLHASPSPTRDPELRRWAVNLIKTRFAAWRSPPVETPADSVIDEVVGEILQRAAETQR